MIPAGSAGSLGIRRDDFDAGFDQVFPGADVFGIAFAYQEYDCRGVRRTVRRQPLLPFFVDQLLAGEGDGVDIIAQRQRHHVGLYTVDHRPGLLAGTAMRLFDNDILPGLLLPIFLEFGVVSAIEFTGRVIRYVEQFNRIGLGECAPAQEQAGNQPAENFVYNVVHVDVSFILIPFGWCRGRAFIRDDRQGFQARCIFPPGVAGAACLSSFPGKFDVAVILFFVICNIAFEAPGSAVDWFRPGQDDWFCS